MSTRTGKIARLPAALRNELNERLDNGQEGPELLDWLNARPEVQALVRDKFDGAPISPQNLSQWRQGGFQDWLLRQELFGEIQALAETAEDAAAETPNGAAIIDHAATVLAVRFGTLLLRWNGEVDDQIQAKARLLNGICRSVLRLQQSFLESTKAAMKEQRQREQKDGNHLDRKDITSLPSPEIDRAESHPIKPNQSSQRISPLREDPAPTVQGKEWPRRLKEINAF